MKRNLSNLQAWHPAVNKGLKTLQKKEKSAPHKTRTSKNKEPHPQRWGGEGGGAGGGGVIVVVVVVGDVCGKEFLLPIESPPHWTGKR